MLAVLGAAMFALSIWFPFAPMTSGNKVLRIQLRWDGLALLVIGVLLYLWPAMWTIYVSVGVFAVAMMFALFDARSQDTRVKKTPKESKE